MGSIPTGATEVRMSESMESMTDSSSSTMITMSYPQKCQIKGCNHKATKVDVEKNKYVCTCHYPLVDCPDDKVYPYYPHYPYYPYYPYYYTTIVHS